MKRRLLIALGLPMAAVVVGGSLWWSAGAAAAAFLQREFARASGLSLTTPNDTLIALLPRPRIKATNVMISAPDGAVSGQVDSLQATIGLLPLLRGSIAIDDLRLTGGTITLSARDADVLRGISVLRQSSHPSVVQDITLVQIGLVAAGDAQRPAEHFHIEEAALRPAWSGGSLQMSARLRWRDETLTVATAVPATDAAPINAMTASLRIAGAASELVASGTLTEGTDLGLNGSLRLASENPSRLARWLGTDGPFLGRLRAIELSGPVIMSGQRIDMAAASLRIGRDTLEGALSLRLGPQRPLISGTLAATTFDATPLLPPPSILRSDGTWSSALLDWSPMMVADLDLRLSATRAQVQGISVEQAAASLILRNGRFEAALGRADFAGGTVRGRLSLAPGAGIDLDAKLQMAVENVAAAALLSPILPPRSLTGAAQGQVQLDATGATTEALIGSMTGRGNLTVRNGEIGGISIPDVVRAADRLPPPVTLDWRGGRTAFETLNVPFSVQAGQVEITSGQLTAAGTRATLSGTLRISNEAVALRAGIIGSTSSSRVPIMFDIVGPLVSPQVTIDMRGIIDRLAPARISPIGYQ